MKDRVLYMDTARSIAMLWIVVVWHLSASIQGWGGLSSHFANIVTTSCLAVFTYISGFFLSKTIRSRREVLAFYQRRFKRFFPLYFIACVSMFVGHLASGSENLMNGRQFALSLFGLSCLIGPSPATLWYFSMLIFFYLLTPLFTYERITKKYKFAFALFGYLLAYLCVRFCNGEPRLLVYYPVYFGAVLFSKNSNLLQSTSNTKRICQLLNLLLLIVSCILYDWAYHTSLNVVLRTGVALFSVNCFLWISKCITTIFPKQLISFFSYISMCCYLFHGQVYLAYEYCFGKMSYLTAYLIVVPVVLFLSWFLQNGYDWLLRERLPMRRKTE